MPTPEDYRTARKLAMASLSEANLETICARAGVSIDSHAPHERRISIPFLTHHYDLIVSKEGCAFDQKDKAVTLPDQVLLLHYLITASGNPVRDDWITFREVPSGPFYYPSFVKRAITPLVRCFGNTPAALAKMDKRLGETIQGPGDVALKVMALPRIPVVLSLWEGDDEFPPEGNVYFDRSIASYLDTEDIAYLAGATVYTTIGLFRSMA